MQLTFTSEHRRAGISYICNCKSYNCECPREFQYAPEKILHPIEIRFDGTGRDAECEDEKLQECYYRHELPKAGCVFQPVGNVPLRFAARGMLFALQTCSIFYIEMQCEISSKGTNVIPYKSEYIHI